MAVVANRAGITRQTLQRVERGDPSVSLGIYATVLFVLGLADKLASVAAVEGDTVGLMLDEERLPKRVRQAVRPAPETGGEE
jgi:transcriptional regulator with XRE-family HTH domain